jgi:hypothetical protein
VPVPRLEALAFQEFEASVIVLDAEVHFVPNGEFLGKRAPDLDREPARPCLDVVRFLSPVEIPGRLRFELRIANVAVILAPNGVVLAERRLLRPSDLAAKTSASPVKLSTK